MGKGNKKVDLTNLFKLGIDVEDLVDVPTMTLRRLTFCIDALTTGHHIYKWPLRYALKHFVEVIAKIEEDKVLKKKCRPAIIKLSKIARDKLAFVYDFEMCSIRNKQRELRSFMEEVKKSLDRYTPLDVYAEQEEDKTENILKTGSVFVIKPEILPQC
jgi:hypothetical protein